MVATSTTSDYALKIRKKNCALSSRVMHLKDLHTGLGSCKSILTALELMKEGATTLRPPPQTRVKMEPWCAKIAIQDQIELVTDLKMIWRIVV